MCTFSYFFFLNDTATPEIYTLPLHDALPICSFQDLAQGQHATHPRNPDHPTRAAVRSARPPLVSASGAPTAVRSEEHTSELQSQSNLVCRLLLEKKKDNRYLHCVSTLYSAQC